VAANLRFEVPCPVGLEVVQANLRDAQTRQHVPPVVNLLRSQERVQILDVGLHHVRQPLQDCLQAVAEVWGLLGRLTCVL